MAAVPAAVATRVPPLLRDRTFRRYWARRRSPCSATRSAAWRCRWPRCWRCTPARRRWVYLTALQWLPSLLFGLILGAWVDRRGQRRRTMIAADLGRAALFGSVPLCYALHVLSMPLLYLVVFAAGTLSILFNVSDGTMFVSHRAAA